MYAHVYVYINMYIYIPAPGAACTARGPFVQTPRSEERGGACSLRKVGRDTEKPWRKRDLITPCS